MFTIRGENVYPSEIDAALNDAGELRRRASHRHHAATPPWTNCCCASKPTTRPIARAPTPRSSAAKWSTSCRPCSASRTRVEIVAPHSIARTDFKARRVIDDREVFRGLNEQAGNARRTLMAVRPLLRTARAPGRWRHAGCRPADLARRKQRRRGARDARADLSPRRRRARHRHHRRARQRQVDAGRQADAAAAATGDKVGIVADRSVEPVFRRRDPRRSHPHDANWPTIPASSSAAWPRAARPAAWRAPRSTPSTSSMSPAIDTVIIETVGVGQDEVEIVKASAHDRRRLGAGPRRRDPGDQGRHPRDRRHPRRVQMRPQRRQSHDRRSQADADARRADAAERPTWKMPVIGTSAVRGTGLDELLDAIERHLAVVAATPNSGRQRRLSIAEFRLRKTAETVLLRTLRTRSPASTSGPLAAALAGARATRTPMAQQLVITALTQGVLE